jgi:hypothetical protein
MRILRMLRGEQQSEHGDQFRDWSTTIWEEEVLIRRVDAFCKEYCLVFLDG